METLFRIITVIILMLHHKRSQVSAHSLRGRNVHGHWLLNGSDPDVSFSSSVRFAKGRCPRTKAADFFAEQSYATVPTTNITDCDFTIAFWMKIPGHHDDILRNTAVFTAISTDSNPLFLSLSKQTARKIHFICGQMLGSNGDSFTRLIISTGQIHFDQWTHLAATCQEKKISLYIDGVEQIPSIKRNTSNLFFNYLSSMAEQSSLNKLYYIGGLPSNGGLSIRGVKFFGSVMDLHVIGVAFTPDEIYDLYRDYALVINVTLTDAKGDIVNVEWEPPSCPANIKMYFVHYREIDTKDWNAIAVFSNVTSYDLQLQSYKEYEITVTTRDIDKDIPRKLWRVRTQGVNQTILVNPDEQNNNTSYKDKKRLKALIITGSVAAVFAVAVGLFCYRRRQLRSVLEQRPLSKSKSKIVHLLQSEVIPERVTLLEELGQGAFGKVHKGVLKELPKSEVFYKPKRERINEVSRETVVAVKVLLDTASKDDKKQFLQEIEFMKKIGSHRNVLSMIGYWERSGPIMLILEYVPHGDLLQWLRNKRQYISSHQYAVGDQTPFTCEQRNNGATRIIGMPRRNQLIEDDKETSLNENAISLDSEKTEKNAIRLSEVNISFSLGNEQYGNNNEGLSAEDLLCFAWQITQGMDYLASRGFVHRDLAARNVLLGEGRTVKIADFGLLRRTYGEIYEVNQMKKLPIKWSAPEALFYGRCTSKSDVWSFGVLLWEMATMGGIPYPGISNKEVYNLLKTGYRMDKPDMCSDEIYKLMLECWKEDPCERPTFRDVIKTLEEMMTKDTPYYDFDKLDENDACYEQFISDSSDTSDPDTRL